MEALKYLKIDQPEIKNLARINRVAKKAQAQAKAPQEDKKQKREKVRVNSSDSENYNDIKISSLIQEDDLPSFTTKKK